MASVTLTAVDLWADGTSVGAYVPRQRKPDGTMKGAAVASGTAAAGMVTIPGLGAGQEYIAFAGGKGRRFVAPGGSNVAGGGRGGSGSGVASSGVDGVLVFGQSLANRGGASDATGGMSSKLAGILQAEETNYAIGGSSVALDDVVGAGGISTLLQKVKRQRRNAPYYGVGGMVVPFWGANDMPTIGQATAGAAVMQPQVVAIVKNAMRTAIAVSRSASRFYAGDKTTNLDALITLGTPVNWTAVANATSAAVGKNGTGAICGSTGFVRTTTNGAGGAASFDIPGDYPGGAVAPIYVVSVVDPGLTAGTLTASGAATGTFDLAQLVSGTLGTADAVKLSNGLIVWRFTAIPAGNGARQTLTITPSGLTGVGGWGLAEFGIEAEDGVLVPLIGVSKSNPFGSIHSRLTNADVDAINTAYRALAAEFPDTVRFVDADAALGGIGASVATTLNGAITATAPASGGNLPLTSTAGLPTAGVLAVGYAGTIEYIAYTGIFANTVVGITRGAYGSVPGAYADLSTAGLVNAAAIPNFALDGTHWTDKGGTVVAEAVVTAFEDLLVDVTKRAARAGAGARMDLRVVGTTGAGLFQTIKPTTAIPAFTPIFFPRELTDTAGMHEPAGVPGLLITPYTRFTAPVDGMYFAQGVATWLYSKHVSAGGVALAGHVTAAIIRYDKAGTQLGPQSLQRDTIAVAADYPNGFYYPITCPTWMGELRKGDYLQFECYQTNMGSPVGVATTLNGALDASQTNVVVTAAAGLAVNDYVRVDDEVMLVTAIAVNTLTVTRAQQGTLAATHSNGNAIYSGRAVMQNATFTMKYMGRI